MKKKAYMTPETQVVALKIEQLMGPIVSGEGITSSDTGDTSNDPNRSRRRRNNWEDEDEEEDW